MTKSVSRSQQADISRRITLDVLDAVQRDNNVSQRQLSKEMGIALGLINAYLKRCVRKGWIKIKAAPANRYGYYLTPKGLTEKSHLTASFLRRSFRFYMDARAQLGAAFTECNRNGWTRVALFGVGELAEIAVICAMDHTVEIVGVVAPHLKRGQFARLPLVRHLSELSEFDAVIVTEIETPQLVFDKLVTALPEQRVLTPQLLRISRDRQAVEKTA